MRVKLWLFLTWLPLASLTAEVDHGAKTTELADEQDELAADVVEMIEQQTAENVIELLTEVEVIMGETIERLDEEDTGSDTLAAQTEIIEKIFEAAEKRQQQKEQEQKEQEGQDGEEPEDGEGEGKPKPGSGQGQKQSQGGGMLEMMRRMMQAQGDGQDPKPTGGQEGQEPGDSAGDGNTGDSDTPNEEINGEVAGKKEERTVPKSSGALPDSFPKEFQKAMDAYNRAITR